MRRIYLKNTKIFLTLILGTGYRFNDESLICLHNPFIEVSYGNYYKTT